MRGMYLSGLLLLGALAVDLPAPGISKGGLHLEDKANHANERGSEQKNTPVNGIPVNHVESYAL